MKFSIIDFSKIAENTSKNNIKSIINIITNSTKNKLNIKLFKGIKPRNKIKGILA